MEVPKITPWIAVIGNPNAGQADVHRKIGLVLNFQSVDCDVDLLAGAHSLFANTEDEVAVWRLLSGQVKVMPRATILVAYAGRLEQELYLASQLLDLGLPAILVLTDIKTAMDNGISINLNKLGHALGIPVVSAEDLTAELALSFLNKLGEGDDKRELHWRPSQVLAGAFNQLDKAWISKHLRHLPAGLRLIEGLRLITHPPAIEDYKTHPAESRLRDLLNQVQNEMMSAGENPSTAEVFQRHAWLRQITTQVVKQDGKQSVKATLRQKLASTDKQIGWIILGAGLILAGGSVAWFLMQ